MTVPLSSVVSVSISSAPKPAALAGFGTLMFITAEAESVFSVGERSRLYMSAAEVATDFPSGEVAAAAEAYYSQSPKPEKFKVGMIDQEDSDITASLNAIEEYDDDFYGVVPDKEFRDTVDMKSIASWVQARTKVLFATTNDAAVKKTSTQLGTVAKDIADLSLSRTMLVYGEDSSQYPCASAAGRAFTVNFRGTNTTLTLFMKKLPGITVSNLSSAQKAALEALNINAFIDVADNYLFNDGRQADGSWFDAIHGQDWLKNYIQTNVFNVLYLSPTKVPYTDSGVSRIVDSVIFSMEQGIRNGLLAPGFDANGDYQSAGYAVTAIPVSEVSDADKGSRIYGGISFSAVGAGALHNIIITGSFS